ncbi:MAG: PEP-CTERM sorting domain-containing protein [Planctomycetota bacterium]
MKTRFAMTAMTLAGFAASASANPTITEIYIGLPGEDGTADWFEITNFTGSTLTYGDNELFYDDESADFADADALPAFTLLDGESLVVLLDDAPEDLTDFDTVWGTGINRVGIDGAGLGQSGDAVTLFDGPSNIIASAAVVPESVSMPTAPANPLLQLQTFDTLNGGRSELGDSGVFSSNTFQNEDIISTDPPTVLDVALIGSPGFAIPEPATAAALALLGVVGLRRRNA